MIEIIFDENIESNYHGKEYPVLQMPCLKGALLSAYLAWAKEIVRTFREERCLIIAQDDTLFDYKKTGLALFIADLLEPSKLDCLVFKVKDKKAAYEAYKPYIALSVGVKYAMRLSVLDVKEVYKELRCLTYLRFSLKEDYETQCITFHMAENKKTETVKKIEARTVFDAILYVSLLKILSLANVQTNLEVKVFVQHDSCKISQEELIEKLLKKAASFYKDC